MLKVTELFGSMVFNDKEMKSRLPQDVYNAFIKTSKGGEPLDSNLANHIALAMKEWALEKGATHYTHWFQPMTGMTAEKHDSFISPKSDGTALMEFSGKELIQGEPDASSFPSGGLRATFEARGYTAWDPTSNAFIKDGTLCIPTAFCSYGGHALDKKTPLLRSMEVLNKQALRILRLFGNDSIKKVTSTVGPEQEYFLIDKKVYEQRADLIYTGRTLFGAKPPKGQELEDHYFGAIRTRVLNYMQDLDVALWELGVNAKTRHNEVAPGQHELAPIYTTANVATDHNQLTMEIMKKVAIKHDLVCLLHEKPFDGVNGSGKHNNWSMITDTGINLLEPGTTPEDNAQFLLFLTAMIVAVDTHQDLLRISSASANNDLRLGANEAPPAIVSIYLGEELTDIIDALIKGIKCNGKSKKNLEIGVDVIPKIPKDTTDRNRTSPFAFTGNKFEFRMVGSSFSIAKPNTIINTIAAEALDKFASELESVSAERFVDALDNLIRTNLNAHKRIIFNGNNYCDDWVAEAHKRGLLNLRSTPEAISHLIDEKNLNLFAKYNVYSHEELLSRYDILLENYSTTIRIEALATLEIARRQILQAVEDYTLNLTEIAKNKKILAIDNNLELILLDNISKLSSQFYNKILILEEKLEDAKHRSNILASAMNYRKEVFFAMQEVRLIADEMESIVGKKYWPLPSYGDLLFSV